MEILELSIICMTAAVSLAMFAIVYLKVKSTEETQKNYREELRAQSRGISPSSRGYGGDSDPMTQILQYVTENPQVIQQVMAALKSPSAVQE